MVTLSVLIFLIFVVPQAIRIHEQPHTYRITPSQRTTSQTPHMQSQLIHDTKLHVLEEGVLSLPTPSSSRGTVMDLGVPSDEEDRNGDISESEDEEEDGGGSELVEDYDSVLDRRGGWDMGFTSWSRRRRSVLL